MFFSVQFNSMFSVIKKIVGNHTEQEQLIIITTAE